MKLLVDACVSHDAVLELRSHGYDVNWVGDWDGDPGDREILRVAHEERRILVTLDKDFGELAVKEGVAHRGVFLLRRLGPRSQGGECLGALKTHGPRLQTRPAIIVVEPGRVRVRYSI